MLDRRLIAVELSIVGGLVGLFAVVGPLKTGEFLSVPMRGAYWASCAALCWPMCHALKSQTLYLFRNARSWQIWLATLASGLFAAIPCGLVVYVVHGLFDNTDQFAPSLLTCYVVSAAALCASFAIVLYVAAQRASLRSAISAADGSSSLREIEVRKSAPLPPDGASQRPEVVGAVGGRFAAASTVSSVSTPEHTATEVHPPTVQQPDRPPVAESQASKLLLDRLPRDLGRNIICLRAVEHYTQVTTVIDTTLVLMRFSDAVNSLDTLGIRVHRSHWAAYRHIKRLRTVGDRTFLQLSGGHEAPVSRPHRAEVQRYLKSLSKGSAP